MPGQTVKLVSGISVVFLHMSDIQRSARFYRDVLGIPLEGDSDSDGYKLELYQPSSG